MLSLKKLPSVESTDFDGTELKQICHFEIPGDGIYDFSQSCVVFPMTIKTTELVPASGTGVHNVSLRFRPQSLVKNCELTCTRGGILETRTHNNFLNVNLNRYIYNTQLKDANALFEGRSYQDEFGNNYSVFRNFNRTGTTTSTELKPEIKVPLSHLFSIGAFPQYPAAALGTSRIRLEFQKGSTNVLQEERRYTQFGFAATRLEADNVAADAPAHTITELTIAPEFRDEKEIPLWVGQKVNIQYRLDGATTNREVVISGIAFAANHATITIPNLLGGATTTALLVDNIYIIEEEVDTIKYEINEPQLLLYQINPSANQLGSAMGKLKRGSQFPFRTWTLEQDNLQETAEFNKQYYLEPNCSNAILWGQAPAAEDELECGMPNLGSFRCQINGVDLTNVDVAPNDVLYKDRLVWVMANSGIPLRQLRGNTNAHTICNSVPFQPVQQQYSVQMKKVVGGADMSARNLHLFKQVQKVLKVSGSSVQVV